MIPPRRIGTAVDPALLDGVLGLAVALAELDGQILAIAADSERGEPVSDEVLDVVLGIAWLARAVHARLPAPLEASPDPPSLAFEPLPELLR
jgi:hypothetical protein